MLITPVQREEFTRTGAVKLEGMLSETLLRECRQQYDWAMAHPSNMSAIVYDNKGFYNDYGTIQSSHASEALAQIMPLITDGPFADAAKQLWDSDRVWFYDYELFRKLAGPERTRTPFHQDTGYLSFTGKEIINFWICFEDIPKSSCLQIVRGSHTGPMYDGTPFKGDDDTAPMYGDLGTYQLPRLPDVEALRAAGDVEIMSWELKKGDVVAFHPNSLHGGGHASDACPERNTLVLRFFGEQCTYKGAPLRKSGIKLPKGVGFAPRKQPDPWLRNLKDGDPYYLAGPNKFIQVRGNPPSGGDVAQIQARL